MDLIQWLPTATAGALAFIVWTKLDKAEKKLDEVHDLMRTELRTMDVRLARIEAHIWPDRQRHEAKA